MRTRHEPITYTFATLVVAIVIAIATFGYVDAADTTIQCQCVCRSDARAAVFAVPMCTECTASACALHIVDCSITGVIHGRRDSSSGGNGGGGLVARSDTPDASLFTIRCFQPGSYKDEIVVNSFVVVIGALLGYLVWTEWLSKWMRRTSQHPQPTLHDDEPRSGEL